MLRQRKSILNLRQKGRGVPQLNTTSTADISFMLLIFFLVTTSMDTDKGLTRQLPPFSPTEKEQQETQVKEGMVMRLHIDGQGRLTCDDQPLELNTLRNCVVEFVRQKGKEHIIQLQAEREAAYNVYFQVQNELVAAYRQLRDAEAMRRYRRRSFEECTEEQKKEIRRLVPQRISEVYTAHEEGGRP